MSKPSVMGFVEDSKRVSRRRHAANLRRPVLAACAEPGASVAQLALAHGLNANLVHKWRRMVDARGITSKAGDAQAEFVSLTLAPGPPVVGVCGATGWGVKGPQQYRPVNTAPVLIGLTRRRPTWA